MILNYISDISIRCWISWIWWFHWHSIRRRYIIYPKDFMTSFERSWFLSFFQMIPQIMIYVIGVYIGVCGLQVHIGVWGGGLSCIFGQVDFFFPFHFIVVKICNMKCTLFTNFDVYSLWLSIGKYSVLQQVSRLIHLA